MALVPSVPGPLLRLKRYDGRSPENNPNSTNHTTAKLMPCVSPRILPFQQASHGISHVFYIPLLKHCGYRKLRMRFKMCALEKTSNKGEDEKMNTTSEKCDLEEQHPLKGVPLTEVPIGCKPRGCISRGGLY